MSVPWGLVRYPGAGAPARARNAGAGGRCRRAPTAPSGAHQSRARRRPSWWRSACSWRPCSAVPPCGGSRSCLIRVRRPRSSGSRTGRCRTRSRCCSPGLACRSCWSPSPAGSARRRSLRARCSPSHWAAASWPWCCRERRPRWRRPRCSRRSARSWPPCCPAGGRRSGRSSSRSRWSRPSSCSGLPCGPASSSGWARVARAACCPGGAPPARRPPARRGQTVEDREHRGWVRRARPGRVRHGRGAVREPRGRDRPPSGDAGVRPRSGRACGVLGVAPAAALGLEPKPSEPRARSARRRAVGPQAIRPRTGPRPPRSCPPPWSSWSPTAPTQACST